LLAGITDSVIGGSSGSISIAGLIGIRIRVSCGSGSGTTLWKCQQSLLRSLPTTAQRQRWSQITA
jgi:hypothetical protein